MLTVLMLAAALAAGCGSDDESSEAVTTTTSATPPPPSVPSVDEPEPTLEQLAGIWHNDGGPTPTEPNLMVRFSRDGTMAFDNGGALETNPAVVGTFVVSGRTIDFTAGTSDACAAGDTWSWTVGLIDDTHLHSVISEDGTGNCSVGLGTEWTWTRSDAASP